MTDCCGNCRFWKGKFSMHKSPQRKCAKEPGWHHKKYVCGEHKPKEASPTSDSDGPG